MGVPFIPVRSMLGTDTLKYSGAKVVKDPFTGKPICLIPALFIDVGLICPGFVRSELGDPEVMKAGMDTDKFTSAAMEQIKAGEFFIVSHAYNVVRITEQYEEVSRAYAKYAPRYEGDDEFDVRTLYQRLAQAHGNS